MAELSFWWMADAASACEELLEASKNNHRGTLVGETTEGTAGPSYIHDFHNGMTIGIVVKLRYFPDGSEFEGIGIKPGVEVHPSVDDLKNGRDIVLDKVLELAEKSELNYAPLNIRFGSPARDALPRIGAMHNVLRKLISGISATILTSPRNNRIANGKIDIWCQFIIIIRHYQILLSSFDS